LLGDATDKDYQNAFEIIEKDGDVNGIIILLTPQSSTDVNAIAQAIAGFKSEKPVITVFIGGSNLEKAREIIENSKKPCYLSPNEAVDSIKALIGYSNSINQLLPSAEGKEIYKEDQKTKILNNYNLPILEYGKADSFDELKQYVKKIGYPVVLKTAKLDIVHKSDSGGVKLNILNETDLKYYFDQLGSPVIVGKMIKGKQEIFLGIKKDPNVGTLIAFGTGGIYSEIYKDFSYRVSPITKDVALEMINETKIGKTLQGARGQEKYNMSILAEIIVNAAKFADQYENIKEIDFNPIIASYPFFHIVDIRIIER
jgi:acetyltransferase